MYGVWKVAFFPGILLTLVLFATVFVSLRGRPPYIYDHLEADINISDGMKFKQTEDCAVVSEIGRTIKKLGYL